MAGYALPEIDEPSAARGPNEMSVEVEPAGGVRRIVAVFIDWFVFFGIWIAVGIFIQMNSLFVALGLFVLVDVLMTGFIGRSAGRFATGIRVVRADGNAPGLARALVRTTLVLFTGFVGFFVYALGAKFGAPTPRMWWDAAAGTQLVSTRLRAGAAR
jgi:uncharacterized RDD family membrane protein YckC